MANTYLSRTSTATGSATKATFSAWVKRSGISNDYPRLLSILPSANNAFEIFFRNTDILEIKVKFNGATRADLQTNRVFRDTSAWYHILVSVDSTSGTADDRVRLYVNGVQETSFGTRVNPDQNANMKINASGETSQIGAEIANSSSNLFNGYMNNVAWVDGTALTPTSFGETDSASGIWKYKSPSGITWGTNGFHLKMDNSANLGLDSSGETNNFTLSGDGRQAKDTPTNSYATLNPLDNFYSASTFANGNTSQTSNASNYGWVVSTLGITSGKFYAECKQTGFSGSSNYNLIGVASYQNTTTAQFLGESAGSASYYAQGEIYNGNGTDIGSMPTYTTNDIIGVAVDLDNNFIYWHKNGVYINSGNPTSGSSGTGGLALTASSSTSLGAYFFGSGDYGTSLVVNNSWNFGNGYFGTTAITSAGSNGNGSLFEYDVPSGYYALNTKNINTYG